MAEVTPYNVTLLRKTKQNKEKKKGDLAAREIKSSAENKPYKRCLFNL